MMKCLGDDGTQLRRIPGRGSSLSKPDAQIVAVHELRYHEAESVVRATHIVDRHDMGMVQPGEDAGFVQIRLHIVSLRDAFAVRNLDGDRAIEVIIVSKKNPAK